MPRSCKALKNNCNNYKSLCINAYGVQRFYNTLEHLPQTRLPNDFPFYFSFTNRTFFSLIFVCLCASESCHVFISHTFCKFILIFPHFLHKCLAYLENSMSRDKVALGADCTATARSSRQIKRLCYCATYKRKVAQQQI